MEAISIYKTGDYKFLHRIKKPRSSWADYNNPEYYDLTTFAEILVSVFDSANKEVKFSTISKEGYNLLIFLDDYNLNVILTNEILSTLANGQLKAIGKTRLGDSDLADGFLDSPTNEQILCTLKSSKL
jgi:hypothetical protein